VDFIHSPTTIADWSAKARREGALVGFVPTMGALHEGHLQLIHRAKRDGHRVVCSIFVNPLQFNNSEDLQNYPRQLEKDRELLLDAGCNALFAPEKEAIFADFTPTNYDLGGLDTYWEGPSRPGHFSGVVNVVERLFHYVRPDFAYFGEKDRQQLTILEHIGRAYRWPERIVPCPTLRAADGLALSSRNARLNAVEREQATILYRALQKVSGSAFKIPVDELLAKALEILGTVPEIKVDYFGIADRHKLAPLSDWHDRTEAIALVAAFVGPVRLIDNITLLR